MNAAILLETPTDHLHLDYRLEGFREHITMEAILATTGEIDLDFPRAFQEQIEVVGQFLVDNA